MSGWFSHTIAFLLGVAVGAVLLNWSRTRRAPRDPRKILRRLYKDSPQFFDEIRSDLGKPEFHQVREFAVLKSGRETFVSENLRFVYYEEDIPDLRTIAATLESNGFIDDLKRGKTPIFRLRQNFVDSLESL